MFADLISFNLSTKRNSNFILSTIDLYYLMIDGTNIKVATTSARVWILHFKCTRKSNENSVSFNQEN